ncbi:MULTISPECIES: hypothetical protein [Streptomyces]|uniref:Uncharacterized protein n=1 Tax=Streptomyces galilaeus TaxID=33899 RepID=A0ABW9IM96_STRGJ
MRLSLIAMHVHAYTGGQPEGCTCPPTACGGAEQGPGIRTGCQAHGAITAVHHHAFDCPRLPADTDLSRLWLVITKWTADGPVIDRVDCFDRLVLANLRARNILWDVSEGDTADDAAHAWQDYIDAMRAEAAVRQSAEIAVEQHRRRLREEAVAALRDSGHRSARRMLTGSDALDTL